MLPVGMKSVIIFLNSKSYLLQDSFNEDWTFSSTIIRILYACISVRTKYAHGKKFDWTKQFLIKYEQLGDSDGSYQNLARIIKIPD